MTALSTQRELQVLTVFGAKLTDRGLQNISRLSKLRILDLSSTNVTGEGVRWPESLENIDLDDTQLTDAGLVNLAKCPHLRSISVKGTAVSDEALDRFEELRPGVSFE